ncbi:MAG: DUF1631 family protein [Halioglobus sp.]|nr:DUF1631 family protein [Halioglobus sp.]
MLTRYADHGTPSSGAPVMAQEELIEYLRTTRDTALSPIQSVLTQAESISNPAGPSAEQAAILRWAGRAFDDWQRDFPLEEPLCTQLRRLRPLVASLAIADPDFFIPGGHPLHQVLDSLQAAAVGWQPSLGRAGQAIESFVVGAIDEALAWFEPRDLDLATLSARVAATTARELARSERMAQRLVEAERGRIKSVEARRTAARMINAALQQLPAPAGIGRFLRGPWYDSAQLVLLKFGEESEQWTQMSATTTALLDSVQPEADDEAPGGRHQLFETVTRLPKELKRWLLSLQHDGEAVASALAVVEFAHMQILRKRPLESEQTELIPMDAAAEVTAAQCAPDAIGMGQWFSMALDNTGPVRARLVLRVETEGQLLFANQAGVKVSLQGFEEFASHLGSGKIYPLDSGASFSRSLARAAGIKNRADLDHLGSGGLTLIGHEEEECRGTRGETLGKEREHARQQTQEELEQEALQREWDEAQRRKLQRLAQEKSSAAPAASAAGVAPQQRRYVRLPVASNVFVEIAAPEPGRAGSGKVARCKTLDVSRGGLRLSLEHELVTGAIVRIGVELPDLRDTLYLTGEVRWCLANLAPDIGWSAGFAIINTGASDIDRWGALLDELEN